MGIKTFITTKYNSSVRLFQDGILEYIEVRLNKVQEDMEEKIFDLKLLPKEEELLHKAWLAQNYDNAMSEIVMSFYARFYENMIHPTMKVTYALRKCTMFLNEVDYTRHTIVVGTMYEEYGSRAMSLVRVLIQDSIDDFEASKQAVTQAQTEFNTFGQTIEE